MTDIILQLALAVIPAILAITLHEAAHGYAALALGDDTARLAGRLSLNPLRHVDRVGTILLPGFLLVFQLLTIDRCCSCSAGPSRCRCRPGSFATRDAVWPPSQWPDRR